MNQKKTKKKETDVETDLCLIVKGQENWEVDSKSEFTDLIESGDLKESTESYYDEFIYYESGLDESADIDFYNGLKEIYGYFANYNWDELKDGSRIKIAYSLMSYGVVGFFYNSNIIILEDNEKNCDLLEKFYDKWLRK